MVSRAPQTKVSPAGASRWMGYESSSGLGISLVSILLAAFSGLGTRWGWWDFRHGLGYFRDSVFAAGAGILLCLGGLAWSWAVHIPKGRVRAFMGLAAGLLIAGNFLSWFLQAKSAPRIHDITTDWVNPPLFEAILPLRQGAPNPPQYGGSAVAEQQQKAYPDIRPLLLSVPPDKAWQACLDTALKMGWILAASDEPQGRIEATDQTFWFGFKDDIVVRVLPQAAGSRVDVRSVSRVGLGDVGTNARRVRKYLNQVRQSLGA